MRFCASTISSFFKYHAREFSIVFINISQALVHLPGLTWKVRDHEESCDRDWGADYSILWSSVMCARDISSQRTMMNSHCHPARPCVPFNPLYTPAWRYPLNIPAIADDAWKMQALLASSFGLYQLPIRPSAPLLSMEEGAGRTQEHVRCRVEYGLEQSDEESNRNDLVGRLRGGQTD
jgi:hypothetical protein